MAAYVQGNDVTLPRHFLRDVKDSYTLFPDGIAKTFYAEIDFGLRSLDAICEKESLSVLASAVWLDMVNSRRDRYLSPYGLFFYYKFVESVVLGTELSLMT